MNTRNTSAIILTGGKNLRMGRNKALEVVAGKSLLERAYERMCLLADEVIVVTSKEFTEVPLPDTVRVVTDIYPEKGPLGGIYTGLESSTSETNIVVGCDMPFLNTSLLGHMLSVLPGYDAVVPMFEGWRREPLHTVYTKRCAGIIGERVRNDQLSIHSFIDTLNVRYVETDEIRTYDPELTSFFNINYPSDLERAAVMAESLDQEIS